MSDASPPIRPGVLTLSEDELLRRATLLHAAGSVANADTYVLEGPAGPLLLKSFRRRPWLVRILFLRWTLRREYRAMRALASLPGVPAVHGIAGKDTLVTEFVQGTGPLCNRREMAAEELPSERFLVRLRDVVAAMHGRGIAHGDIRRQNILRGPVDTPYLIDFATAVSLTGPLPALRRRAIGAFRKADLYAVAKIINSYRPEMLTADEQRRLTDLPWHLRLGRFLRKHVYGSLIKQKAWRERWDNWRQGRFRRPRRYRKQG